MNEERFTHQIRQHLDSSLPDISERARLKLEAARKNALACHKLSESQLVLSTSGKAHGLGHGNDHTFLRRALAITALLVGMAFAYYWEGQQSLDELEEIDSALLRGELPPDAYLDKGFAAWLKHSSEQ